MEEHRKVFGLGLSRTGTSSLGQALNRVGIKAIHFPSDKRTFEQLRNADYKLDVLDEYQAVVDIPLVEFYAQIDEVFPGSKFILTIRNIDSWIASVAEHWRVGVERERDDFMDFAHTCVYGSLAFNENRFRYVYQTHCRNVREYFLDRPNDLLIMDIVGGDSWDKLCPFLGVPVPLEPFPNLNSIQANKEWRRRR